MVSRDVFRQDYLVGESRGESLFNAPSYLADFGGNVLIPDPLNATAPVPANQPPTIVNLNPLAVPIPTVSVTPILNFFRNQFWLAPIRKLYNYAKVPATFMNDRLDWGPDLFFPAKPIGDTYWVSNSVSRVSCSTRMLKDGTDTILASNSNANYGSPSGEYQQHGYYQIPFYVDNIANLSEYPMPKFDIEFYFPGMTVNKKIDLTYGENINGNARQTFLVNLPDTERFYYAIQLPDPANLGGFVFQNGWNYIPFTLIFQKDGPRLANDSWVIKNLHTCLPLETEVIEIDLHTHPDVVAIDNSNNVLSRSTNVDNVSTFEVNTTSGTKYDTVWTQLAVESAPGVTVHPSHRYFRVPKSVYQTNADYNLPVTVYDPWGRFSSGNSILGPTDPDWGNGAVFTQGDVRTWHPGHTMFPFARFNYNSDYFWIRASRGLLVLNKLTLSP